MDTRQTPSLTVVGGPCDGRGVTLGPSLANVSIGSDPACRLAVPLPGVVPLHARIWFDGARAALTARGGAVVRLNGAPLRGEADLRHGDRIVLGDGDGDSTALEYREVAVSAASAASPQPVASSAAPRLVVSGGALDGRSVELGAGTRSVSIGSDPACRLALAGRGVKPLHARLWFDGARVTLNASGGAMVLLNGAPLRGEGVLQDGDSVVLGETDGATLVFLSPTPPAVPAAAPVPVEPVPPGSGRTEALFAALCAAHRRRRSGAGNVVSAFGRLPIAAGLVAAAMITAVAAVIVLVTAGAPDRANAGPASPMSPQAQAAAGASRVTAPARLVQ